MKSQLKTLTLAGAVLLSAACAKLERVEATPKTLLFTAANQTQAAGVKGFDQNGKEMKNVPFTFASSNPAVATVDATGQVKSVKSGSATIEVSSGDKKDALAVDVKIPARIVFGASPMTLTGVGSSAQLDAKVLDEVDRPIDGATVTFAVTDALVATAAEKTVTSVGVGTTKLTATFGGLKGETDLTVALPPFETVAVEPATVTVKAGEEAFVTTTIKDAAGAAVAGVAVTFASSDAKIATVESGKIKGVAAGSATITASAGDKKTEIKVTVKK